MVELVERLDQRVVDLSLGVEEVGEGSSEQLAGPTVDRQRRRRLGSVELLAEASLGHERMVQAFGGSVAHAPAHVRDGSAGQVSVVVTLGHRPEAIPGGDPVPRGRYGPRRPPLPQEHR